VGGGRDLASVDLGDGQDAHPISPTR
jgi:hypothetical protein